MASTHARDDRSRTEPLEAGIQLDFHDDMSYSDYLHLDEILGAQHPRSAPNAYDELLFIIQHQTTELWFKLVLHELRGARAGFRGDDLPVALKRLARVKHIIHTLTAQWSILATLTPSEYLQFRNALAKASGFQSAQYRSVEFILGNKNADLVALFDHDEIWRDRLAALLAEPTLYDEFLRFLARHGHAVPESVLQRDVTQAHTTSPELVPALAVIYRSSDEHWPVYEACETLIDIEDGFQFWRFRHLRTVQRVIGTKTGTGGSSGVGFLSRALGTELFPELYAVRTELDG